MSLKSNGIVLRQASAFNGHISEHSDDIFIKFNIDIFYGTDTMHGKCKFDWDIQKASKIGEFRQFAYLVKTLHLFF